MRMMKKGVFVILAAALVMALIPAASADSSQPALLNIMTQPIYDEIGMLSEGLIWARQGGTFSYLDEKGNVAISAEALKEACGDVYDVRDFHEGYAVIYCEQGTVYIDTQCNVAFTAERGFSFSDSSAVGWSDGSIVAYDNAGREHALTVPSEVLKYDDWDCGVVFREGLLPFWVTSGGSELNGYVNTDLNIVIPFQFEDARPFNGGFAPVKKNGLWGFIDKTGEFVIEPQFEDFLASDAAYSHLVFHEGLAAVKKDGKWGYIDSNGTVRVQFIWDSADQFSEGYAVVGSGGKYGYIDTSGQTVIPAQYDDANFFNNNAALVGVNGEYWLIGTDGSRLSQVSWSFDRTVISQSAPWLTLYQRGSKWGIAQIGGDMLDSATEWAKTHIVQALEKGFIPEALQGSYSQPITRGEFVTLAVRWLEYKTGKDYETLVAEHGSKGKTFTDTTDPVILAGANLSITDGVGGGRFGTNDTFNREQAAVMLCKVMEVLGQDTKNAADYGFTDILTASGWSQDSINYVSGGRVMSGISTTGKVFSPKGTFSRQESITTFNKMD